MPFYEYQCKSCGHALEAMQKVSDSPLKKCPSCGKSQLVRLMSAPVFRLKGAGWYETDFKGEQDKKKNLADRPEAAAKDESKPAAEPKAGEAGAPAGDAAKTAEKPADKPADKPAAAAAGASSRRSGKARPRPVQARPAAKKGPKKSPAKPKRRA
jgi:putative FmdB family regulatory protein